MKRFFCIILTAILLLTAVACQRKPDAQEEYIEFETKSQDDNSDNTDTSVPPSEQTPTTTPDRDAPTVDKTLEDTSSQKTPSEPNTDRPAKEQFGEGATTYIDSYVTPGMLKLDETYTNYLLSIRDTDGAMLIKGKKNGNTVSVLQVFMGNIKVGDTLSLTDGSAIGTANEYILALQPDGDSYKGIDADNWQFEITPEYKTDDKLNHDELESTIQMRLFNDYIYSYRDKSYVPPLSDDDSMRYGLGSWRTVLKDGEKEIAFKYAGDFFPHHTKFANVDIYSTPSTKKRALLVYEKPGPTDGQATYKRRYVEFCELPEQMKNDPYYDMYIVEHIDGRREMFHRGKQAFPYYEDTFKYVEGNTLKDTLGMVKDYLGYDITSAEAISSIRIINNANNSNVAIDNKADIQKFYDKLAKASYSSNNIPKDQNNCNVVINLIRSEPAYAFTIWLNLDTGITRCGYKLDADTLAALKALF